MGVGKFLREKNRNIIIAGVEPEPGHSIQGLKNMEEAIVPSIYDPLGIDKKIRILQRRCLQGRTPIATDEGIFTGMSSGAALAGAFEMAASIGEGVIATVFPDRGDRYWYRAVQVSLREMQPLAFMLWSPWRGTG